MTIHFHVAAAKYYPDGNVDFIEDMWYQADEVGQALKRFFYHKRQKNAVTLYQKHIHKKQMTHWEKLLDYSPSKKSIHSL